MTQIYTHTGNGGVVRKAESAQHAADIVARREYGKRGFCYKIRVDSHSEDRTSYTYQAFIGRPSKNDPRTISGRNIWIYERQSET